MNTIDKTEIALMLEQTKKNREIVRDTTKPYHDVDACKYINDALENYTEVYYYIRDTIMNNKEIFFNLDKLRIDNGSFAGTTYFHNAAINHNINEMFTIKFRLKLGNQKYWAEGSRSLYASVSADSIYDIDPYIYTSNTKKWEYKYGWGNDHEARDLMIRKIVIDSDSKFSAKGWTIWCEKAKWIRKHTEILVREFKSALQSKLEQSKNAVSNAIADSVRRDAENKIKYEKVVI
jgi:hypothetical protein